MLISGLIPAIPLMLARPFLPESPLWKAKRDAGTLRRPSVVELFRPRFRVTTAVTAVMVASGYAASFGANLQVPRIVPGLAEVRAMSTTARTYSPVPPTSNARPPRASMSATAAWAAD